MRRKMWLVIGALLVIAVGQCAAQVFPSVQLTSFDPATSTYVYTVSCPANSTYPFGYFQVDTLMTCPPAPNQWLMQGALVGGLDKIWPKGIMKWDMSGHDAVYWDPISRGMVIAAGTAWTGEFVVVVPGSIPTPGFAATKDGVVGSYKVHSVLVPGPAPIDSAPPVTTIELDGTEGSNNWFVSPVMVTLSAIDVDGAVSLSEYSWDTWSWSLYDQPFEFAENGIFSISARSKDDSDNLEDPPVQAEIKIDMEAPTVVGSVTTLPNVQGWYSGDVTIDYTAVDLTSGLTDPSTADPGVQITFSHTVSSEGGSVFDTGTAADVAGNIGSATVSGLKIDKTAPAVSVIDAPTGSCNLINYENAVIRFSASDAVSGIASVQAVATVIPTGGWSLQSTIYPTVNQVSPGIYEATFVPQVPGVYTVSLVAKDIAGNIGQLSAPVTFEFGGFTVEWLPPISTMDIYWMEDGSTVPVKFRLLDPCSNNAWVSTYPYKVSVVDSAGNVKMEPTTPSYDPVSGSYHVNVQTKNADKTDWEVGDYTVVISGPGIWDVVSGPYKSKYGLQLIDKGVAKGSGKR